MRTRAAFAALALAAGLAGHPACAQFAPRLPASEPGLLCREAVRLAEAGSTLPRHMLGGIARVESGRTDPVTGRFHPWPWTINAEGRGYFFDSKAEAIAFARQLQARGVRSFDTGCLQVNLMYHPNAFQSLEEAFDPLSNARYAVRFLTQLRDKTGSWDTAAAWYHSANPEHGTPYQARVVTAMAEDAKIAGSLPTGPVAGQGVATAGLGFGGAMSSMPSRPGNVMMMSGRSLGMVLPQPAGGFAPGAGQMLAASAPAMPTAAGRGLDAYRQQPVAIVGPRLMASR